MIENYVEIPVKAIKKARGITGLTILKWLLSWRPIFRGTDKLLILLSWNLNRVIFRNKKYMNKEVLIHINKTTKEHVHMI